MTDKSKPEAVSDDDLDGVQGGGRVSGRPPASTKGDTSAFFDEADALFGKATQTRFIGETEKNIVASSGDGSI